MGSPLLSLITISELLSDSGSCNVVAEVVVEVLVGRLLS